MMPTLQRASTKRRNRATLGTHTPEILCVDDDPAIHTALQLRLRDYDVNVSQAFYGMQGVSEAVRSQPDVIVMDLAMPNGDGLYVIECLRNNPATCSIPIVVLSGMRDPSRKRQAFDNGAEAFLMKPVAFADLVEELSHYVELTKG
ncbi:MAG: response regulator [Planctomycetota bacterium]